MPYFSLLVVLSIAVCMAIFAGQNPVGVVVQFVALRSVELPLGLVVALAAGLGLATAAIAALLLPRRSFSSTARQLRARLESLEQKDSGLS